MIAGFEGQHDKGSVSIAGSFHPRPFNLLDSALKQRPFSARNFHRYLP